MCFAAAELTLGAEHSFRFLSANLGFLDDALGEDCPDRCKRDNIAFFVVRSAAYDAVFSIAPVKVDEGQFVRVGVGLHVKYFSSEYGFEMAVDMFDGVYLRAGHGDAE